MSTFRNRCATEMASVAAGKRPTGFTKACAGRSGMHGLGAGEPKVRVGRSIFRTIKAVGREGLWAARKGAHHVSSKATAWSERRHAARKAKGMSGFSGFGESPCKQALRAELARAGGNKHAKGQALARYMAAVRSGSCGR